MLLVPFTGPCTLPTLCSSSAGSAPAVLAGTELGTHLPHLPCLWVFELKQRVKKIKKIPGAANAQLEKHKVPRTANPINNNHNPSSG